ncbi:MAG: nucleotidyltransferase [Boseongicola sp. SB0673_bin_14]|nr:nucleotidyltransferase [Nitrospira sp. SB0675_bin_23]MYI70271.1 nucleotidyltransferase [Boseongicola sp. SB0673_bin_14]
MSIPERQLEQWSSLGAQRGSADTYASIKNALGSHSFPPSMTFSVYLQGSYPNHTNIRGDSDVDIIVETDGVFYHNVPEDRKLEFGLVTPGSFIWSEFRDEVRRALSSYYGGRAVVQGNKSIKVSGYGNRLNADVVPCTEYRAYSSPGRYAKGITFFSGDGVQIINHPKLHLENGSTKNGLCSKRYKPTIRVFKNARNNATNDFPSYFLECLLYNVPNNCFVGSYSQTFVNALQHLCNARNDGSLSSFVCQNERQRVFGPNEYQISIGEAEICVDALVDLWNNW